MNLVSAFNMVQEHLADFEATATQQAVIFAMLSLMNRQFWRGGIKDKDIAEFLHSDIRTVKNAVNVLIERGMLKRHSTGKVGLGSGRDEETDERGGSKRGEVQQGRTLAELAKAGIE